ncbi:MAG TPA: glycoside hydrolase family 3 N-terminal domain-containing protein [Candidatus Nitrosocosmicus sp.]|nr:glycoside hydrolase family 3 N-terminal domain-containing protein [Candidatus Nitrosocosmicus sp.]
MLKRVGVVILICMLSFSMLNADQVTSTTNSELDAKIEALLKQMTIDEKIGQMVMADIQYSQPEDISGYFLGAVLSSGMSVPNKNSQQLWLETSEVYKKAGASTRLGIPLLCGIDAVHGQNSIYEAVIYPHNIGLGAAADPELMYEIGKATAKEMLATGYNWNFAPSVAVVKDARWGRTYEGYGESTELVNKLLVPYIKAIQENGVAATAKHYIADGVTAWGTGDSGYQIDQGDAVISEKELRETHLPPYQDAVAAGVKTIMVSYSSWNGLKNHENEYLIQKVLKGELGFKGFVVSDYEAVHQLKNRDFYEQIVATVNAGVDMLMNGRSWQYTIGTLQEAVRHGDIKAERIDDVVRRILRVKLEMGLFDADAESQKPVKQKLGSEEFRQIAEKAVRESLVLLKNERNILPLKKNAKLLVFGPAANDIGIQCGGWTLSHSGGRDKESGEKWTKGTTILEGFKKIAAQSGGSIITDVRDARNADAVVVVIGEKPYVEGHGDDNQIGVYQGTSLEENRQAIEAAKATGLPMVVIIVSGRPRDISQDIGAWPAVVEAWLPGSEGGAVADVLYGNYDFSGKLPVSWAKAQGTSQMQPLFPYGHGLKMKAK